MPNRLPWIAAIAACALALPASASAASSDSTVDHSATAEVFGGPSSSFESPVAAALDEQVAAALQAEDTVTASANHDATLPGDAASDAALSLPDGSRLTMGLPASGDATALGAHAAAFEGSSPATDVVVQKTAAGLRALISIDDPSAPERYAFPIGGDVASLERQDDGSVLARDADGAVIAELAVPWARDADGRSVPTHFEVDGTTVYQVVEHRGGGFTYGITADPWWNPFSWGIWSKIGKLAVSGITKCGGGALKGALGVGGGVVTVNVISKGAGTAMVRAAGGPYVYVSMATAGCIANLL